MQLSLGQSQRLEQRVLQLLKQELSLELRVVLKQMLQILQRLVQKWEISMDEIRTLSSTMTNLSYEDRQKVAHELVRKSKTHESQTLLSILRFVAAQDQGLSGIYNFSCAINDKLKFRQVLHQQQAITLGLRIILKRPDFLGGQPGEPENLSALLEAVPQWNDSTARYEWVLAGGWAVELLTREHLREHHDLDAVLLVGKPLYLDCDVVHTEDYFGVLSCTPRFIRDNCIVERQWQYEGNQHTVGMLCPEFLFLSKILRPPRPQDWEDVKLLVKHFAGELNFGLILKLIRRNSCGFTQTRKIMEVLRTRDADLIIDGLQKFR
jgi:hypothetical protein